MIDAPETSESDEASGDRAAHVAELRRRVRAGEYRVDPVQVADALLRRLSTAGRGREAHHEDRGAADAAGGAGLIAA